MLGVESNTSNTLRLYDVPLKEYSSYFNLFSGDANQDGIINAADHVEVRRKANHNGYVNAVLNLDGVVNAIDRTIVRNNSFRAAQVP